MLNWIIVLFIFLSGCVYTSKFGPKSEENPKKESRLDFLSEDKESKSNKPEDNGVKTKGWHLPESTSEQYDPTRPYSTQIENK